MTIEDFGLFAFASLMLNVTPGNDMLFVFSRSISLGVRTGSVAALGIGFGTIVHITVTALGLSALLASAPSALKFVKYTGAAYLIYLGIRAWLSPSMMFKSEQQVRPIRYRAVLLQGVLTNVLNPKVALFFLAFLPQFVDPLAHSKLVAFLFLGASCLTTGTIWCVFLALAASKIGSRLRTSTSASIIIRRLTGTLFAGLGLRLAVTK